MSKIEQKKDNSVRNMLVGAAVVGAGIAATAILSKKENREKIGKAFNDAKDKGMKTLSNINDKKDEIVKNIVQEFENIKTKVISSKDAGAKGLKKEVDSISLIVDEIKKSNKENVDDLISQFKVSIKNLKNEFEKISKN